MQLSIEKAMRVLKLKPNLVADIFIEKDLETLSLVRKFPVSELTKESLENYITEYDSNSLILKTYRKNGTSYKHDNEIEIILNEATNQKTYMNGTSSFEEHNFSSVPSSTFPMSGSLDMYKFIASEKTIAADKLERRNKVLEDENTALKSKLLRLENDLLFKDREHELSMQAKENEKGIGLSGIVEQAIKPEVWQHLPALIGAIKGISPNSLPAADMLGDVTDPAHKTTLTTLISYLKTSPQKTAQLYAVAETDSNNPGFLDNIIQTLSQE